MMIRENTILPCHSREGGNPGNYLLWIPAFAGMTKPYSTFASAARFILITGFIYLPTCSAMSSPEAVFRCKSSITKAEDTCAKLNNADLKRVAKAAISIMQNIFNELSHGIASKDLPAKTHQCIQHAECVEWLKESIEPAIQAAKSESRSPTQKTDSEPENTKTKPSTKPSPKKTKREEKKIEVNQRNLDLNALEKILKSEKNSKSTEASQAVPQALTPFL